jgi:hypothetical protein
LAKLRARRGARQQKATGFLAKLKFVAGDEFGERLRLGRGARNGTRRIVAALLS